MQTTITLRDETCCVCMTHFAIDSYLFQRRKEDGKLFYCPNGHAQHYTESEVAKLKEQNENLAKRLHWAENGERRAREDAEAVRKEKAVIKGQLTKTRNRIANGVCPCCHRTFVNVARHVTTKHPDFKEVVG